MKPILIITIAVVCSVITVLGVLVGLESINTIQVDKTRDNFASDYDEYQRDLSRAYSYNQEYVTLKESQCLDKPPPTTYDEAKQMYDHYKKILQEIADAYDAEQDEVLSEWVSGDKIVLTSVTPTNQLSNLEDKMKNLQKKYPNNSGDFTFDVVTCPYAEEWDRAKKRLDAYRESQQ